MNIMDIFDKAKQNLKYPRYTYMHEGKKIQFSLAGPNSARPGTLNITNGAGYGEADNLFYGRVIRLKTGNVIVEWSRAYQLASSDIRFKIAELIDNPVEEGKLHGQKFAHCCFCSTELTSKSSLAVGYGPICAEKWGLPWGLEDNVEDNLENL